MSLSPRRSFLGTMSAQALLSVIAPTVLAAPQGAPADAASGFQSLLAALIAGDERHGEPLPTVGATVDGTARDSFTQTDFPNTPPPLLAVPLVVPEPALDTDPATGSAGSDASLGLGPTLQATTPLLVEKVTNPKGSGPQVLPGEADPHPAEVEPADETRLTLAGTAAVTEAAEARARMAGALVTPTLPPQAPALRPLAERTSKPVEATTVSSEGTSGLDGIKPPVPASTPANAPPTAGQERQIVPEPFAAVLAADTAAAADAEDRSADLPRTAETTTARSPMSAGVQDGSLSTLSRATIDATAQIAAQIMRKLEGRSTRFEMALTPDELGRVDVKLDIDSEGRLNARLAFDNPLAATDMKGRVDDLRRQLEDAGFHLANDAFEFADRDSGSSAFDRGQTARDGQSRAFVAASRLNEDIDLAQPPRWLSLTLSPSGVDMKV